MKKFFLFIAFIISSILPAMEHDTPAEVALLVTFSEIKKLALHFMAHSSQFAQSKWEDLSREEKETVLKSIDTSREMKDSELDKAIQGIDDLPNLAALVVSRKDLLQKVFYGFREYLPLAYSGIEFEEKIPFDFDGDEPKILAIGGTDEEINWLSHEPYNVNASTICAINVLEKGAHYMADVNLAAHMATFKNRFSFAFANAVPFDDDKAEDAFKNIVSSLKDDGIFLAHLTYFNPSADITGMLLQSGFSSAATLYRNDTEVWFIASKAPREDLENSMKESPVSSALLKYVTKEIAYRKEHAL